MLAEVAAEEALHRFGKGEALLFAGHLHNFARRPVGKRVGFIEMEMAFAGVGSNGSCLSEQGGLLSLPETNLCSAPQSSGPFYRFSLFLKAVLSCCMWQKR